MSPGGGWVLDFTRLMLIKTQVEVGVEPGKMKQTKSMDKLLSVR